MFEVLQVVTAMAVSVAMALSLAHALEFPGKRRLTKDIYYSVQPIYYPGFTIGGAVGEYGGLLLLIILLFLMPKGSTSFWLTLVAVLGVIGMQTVYWIFTHPVNKVWLKEQQLDRMGSGFFSLGKKGSQLGRMEWTELRDRWECSHVVRAVFSMVSFIALVTAISL